MFLSQTVTAQIEAVAESRVSHYRPDVDGLRAVAVLAVLAYHAFPEFLPGGFAGVDVFFVISGFLISGIIFRELALGQFQLTSFYARRVRRIFPALLAVLCVVWLLGWSVLFPDELRRLGEHMAAGAAFGLNLQLFMDMGVYALLDDRQLLHLWSLGIEEQFYLLWPLLLAFVWQHDKQMRSIAIVMAIAAISFALNIALVPWNPLAAFYLPTSRFWELALGGALALAGLKGSLHLDGSKHRWVKAYGHHVLGLAGIAMLVASFVWLSQTWSYPGVQGLVPTLGTVLLIAAGPSSWVNRLVLSFPGVVSVGLISYPLYLWHWPLLSFARTLEGGSLSVKLAIGVLALAFVLAILTYRFIELPIRRSAVSRIQVAALCGGVAVCAGIGILTYTQSIPARQRSAESMKLEPTMANWLTGSRSFSWSPLFPDYITIGDARHQVVYVGDSFMQQYYLRVAKIVEEHPQNLRSAVFAVRAHCPPFMEVDSMYGRAACIEHGKKALEYARRPNVDTVVLGSMWLYLATGPDGSLRPDADELLAPLRRAIVELRQSSKHVYIILPSPLSGKFNPRRMLRRSILSREFEVQIPSAPSLTEVTTYIAPTRSKLIELAHETGARVIDPVASLCGELNCPVISAEGDLIYLDDGHIRPSYARLNATYIDETLLHD